MPTMHVAGVCGSLREASRTRIAIRYALDGAEAEGATTRLIDLRDLSLPVFDADERDAGDAPALRRRLREADAILLGTPMYHGSYGSPIKTAIDYCGFDEFDGKTVGLLVVSGGRFPITALDHLRSVCRALDAWVLPYEAAVPSASEHVTDDGFVDAELEDRVRRLGEDAVRYANIRPSPPTFESDENVGAR